MKCLAAVCLVFPCTVFAVASEGDYITALNRYYSKQPDLCIGMPEWPVTLIKLKPSWESGRLLALMDAGLTEARIKGTSRVFNLTSEGRASQGKGGDLCYGRFYASKIISNSPAGTNLIEVCFTYKIKNAKNWAYNHELRMAFSELDNIVGGAESVLWCGNFSEKENKSVRLLSFPVQKTLYY